MSVFEDEPCSRVYKLGVIVAALPELVLPAILIILRALRVASKELVYSRPIQKKKAV